MSRYSKYTTTILLLHVFFSSGCRRVVASSSSSKYRCERNDGYKPNRHISPWQVISRVFLGVGCFMNGSQRHSSVTWVQGRSTSRILQVDLLVRLSSLGGCPCRLRGYGRRCLSQSFSMFSLTQVASGAAQPIAVPATCAQREREREREEP